MGEDGFEDFVVFNGSESVSPEIDRNESTSCRSILCSGMKRYFLVSKTRWRTLLKSLLFVSQRKIDRSSHDSEPLKRGGRKRNTHSLKRPGNNKIY